jgi:2,3-dihydroxybenzoate-AMP ligase
MTGKNWGGRLPEYPAERAREYRQAGLWRTRTLADEFHAVAAAYPDNEAVVSAEGRLTYAQLDRRSDQIAAGLIGLGLVPGDPVLFQVNNRLHTIVAWYAVLKAGLVPVASLSAYRMHEISQIGARSGATAHLVEAGNPGFDLVGFAVRHQAEHPGIRQILTAGAAASSSRTDSSVRLEDLGAGIDPAEARRLVNAVQAGLDPDDVAVFQLSGGTTGVPKLIPRRHAEYWYNAVAYAQRLGWTSENRVAHLIPVIHNAGIVCGLHAPHSTGACVVLGTPDAVASFPLLVQERATDVVIGHGHYQPFLDTGLELLAGSMQRVVLSGAKVPPRMFDQITARGIWSGQLFGMAEGLLAVTPLGASAQARLTTVGTPLSDLDEIAIMEPGTENVLPQGVTGELVCRGPYTLPGYFDAPEHNATAFTVDGFYRTGDLASVQLIDGLPCISIDGRIKDVINRGGEKINAEEVELLLLQHQGIVRAAVVAMPDKRLGERTCAYLVARDQPLDLDEIRTHLAGLGVAKFKWPERLEWVPELPQSNIGKIDKKLLRGWIAAKAVQGAN